MTLSEVQSARLGTSPTMESTETMVNALRPEEASYGLTGGASSNLKVCSGCHGTIVERYYLLVGDRSWHQMCLKCQVCQRTLSEEITCYDKLGRIYCREDYVKLFGLQKACSKCQSPVSPSELVMKVRGCVYHLACFCCSSCDRQLCPGEYFGMDGEHVFCRLHYEHIREQWGHTDGRAFPPGSHKGGSASGDLFDGREDASGGGGAGTGGGGHVPKNPKGRPRKKKAPKVDEEPLDCHPESPRGVVSTANPTNELPSAAGEPTATRNGTPGPLGYDGTSSEVGMDEMQMDAGIADSPERASHLAGVGGSSSSSASSSSHPQRQKRVRTSFKHHQLRTMKSYFSINHNPDAKDLKQLAEKTGLSKRVLQVWFQNARAKFRRSLMKHQGGDPTGCMGGPHKLLGGDPSPHKLCSTDSNGNALPLHHHLEHPLHHGSYLRPPTSLSESQHSPSQSDLSSNASLPDLSMGMDLSAPTPSGPGPQQQQQQQQQQHRVTPLGMSLPVY